MCLFININKILISYDVCYVDKLLYCLRTLKVGHY